MWLDGTQLPIPAFLARQKAWASVNVLDAHLALASWGAGPHCKETAWRGILAQTLDRVGTATETMALLAQSLYWPLWPTVGLI